ncbi:MAG: hypothetical protein K1X55_13145 [Chitinophagales bacterium]|nr:hypothetical protein [Chitinophagales bacterium]
MEDVRNEIEYCDGFNKAYWLFQFDRDLANTFLKNEVAKHTDFSIGFTEGLQQAFFEKDLNEFERLRNLDHENEQGIER